CMFLTLCTFLLNDTAPTEIYTLSLHDALPILFERINDENDGGNFQNPEREHRQTVGDEELNERRHHGRDHCQHVDQRISWQHDVLPEINEDQRDWRQSNQAVNETATQKNAGAVR